PRRRGRGRPAPGRPAPPPGNVPTAPWSYAIDPFERMRGGDHRGSSSAPAYGSERGTSAGNSGGGYGREGVACKFRVANGSWPSPRDTRAHLLLCLTRQTSQ